MRRHVAPISLLAAMLLGACASTPLSPTGELPPLSEPAPNEALRTEQRWLQEWFQGTPVVIATDERGALRIDVPLRHSFDAGSSAVKEPLAAVLRRVATSMRRQATSRVHLVAPRDRGDDGSMALERGDRVTDHLVSLGIGPQRIASVLVGPPTVMHLRLEVAPAP